MKNRLMGLLALVLCVMMTVVPFAGAMAMAQVHSDLFYCAGNWEDVRPGDRIVGEIQTQYTYEDYSVAETYPVYTLRVTDDGRMNEVKFGAEEDGIFGLPGGKKVTRVDLTTGGNGYHSQMELASSLAVKQQDTTGNVTVMISEGLETPLYPNTASEVEQAFKDADARGMKFYEIGAYNTLITDDAGNPLVLRPVQSSATINLKAPSNLAVGDEYTLYHFKYNDGEKGIVETVTSGTLGEDRLITFTLSHFSPFALAYGAESSEGGASVPSTGDNSQLMLWFALMGLSFVGMMIIRRRKHA